MLNIKPISLDDDLSWDGLIKESDTATFFQMKEWLRVWAKHWCKSGKAVIYAIFDKEELIGIAPFHISSKINILGAPGPLESGSLSDFGDIIIKSGKEREVWEAVIKELGEDNIELNFIREESPSFEILKKLGGKAEELESAPVIDLPKTWDDFLTTLDRHDRHEIRRKTRKVENENVIKVCDEMTTDNINDFFRLMASSNVKKGEFLSVKMRAFLSEAIIQLGQKKLLTLCFLKREKVNIAAILLFFERNNTLLYNSGFDAKYSYLSAGLILNTYAIKEAIEAGKGRFDFLRGGEKYKYDLGGKERKLYKITFY